MKAAIAACWRWHRRAQSEVPGQRVEGRHQVGRDQAPTERQPVIPQYLENEEITIASRSCSQAQLAATVRSVMPW